MTSSEHPKSQVATYGVDAGVDFSFRSANRERRGLVNLLQVTGRADRSGEYSDIEDWDFRQDEFGGLLLHSQAKVARGVLADIFKACAKLRRLITANTRTVLVDQALELFQGWRWPGRSGRH